MPQQLYRSWKYTRVLVCLLRCALTASYLWVMLYAAAVMPVMNEHSKWFFWMQHIKCRISYSSLLTFDMQTQSYIVFSVLLMLYRLYQCSRCNFFNTVNNIRRGGKVPLNKRMFVYFGPYLLLFLFCWLATMYSIMLDISRILNTQYEGSECLYCKIIMAVLFKVLVMTNAIIQCIRCTIILHKFANEPEEVRNVHNFGEHLNFFFLN